MATGRSSAKIQMIVEMEVCIFAYCSTRSLDRAIQLERIRIEKLFWYSKNVNPGSRLNSNSKYSRFVDQ